MKLFFTIALTVFVLDLQAQKAVPRPFVFGHDKDVPLAASVIGASDFLFMDWDGDGDNDMMTTSGGAVKLIENIGGKKKPRFNNVFVHNQVVLKDARMGRFFSLIRHSGVKAQQNLPAFIAFERHNQVSDSGKKQLALHMFIPVRGHGKTTWTVMQAFNTNGKPVQDFLDCWISPTIDVADLDGDGKEDLIVGSSHPRLAQPSLKFAAGYNNPQESWNPFASRLYIMYNRSTPDSLIFGKPLVVEADGSPVSPFGFPYPIAFDMDKDGLTDLVVGQHKPGLMYFRNTGTKTQPRFTNAGLINNEHKKPILSIMAIHPRFADLDGDGRRELFASTYFGCVDNILRFTPKNGGWAEQEPLMMASDKNTPVMPQGIGTIEPIDWDGDGDTDLVVGSEPAAPKVVINKGDNANPVWEVPAPLKFTDGSQLEYYSIDYGRGSVWGPMEWYMERVLPRLADWDGDGIRDMLTGSMGLRQLFLKGRMIKGELRFEKPVAFKVEKQPLAAGQRVQPAILDLTADGHPDLIALDDQNILKLWPGNGTDELGQPQTFLGYDGKPLQVKTRILDIGHGRSSFTMTDWDLDGKPDLLIYYAFDRKRGGIYYYRASGKPMQFEKPVKFLNLLSFHNGGIALSDWNGDGYLDIFTGGDGGHLGKSAVPRGKLFLLSGKDLPVPPAVRKPAPITVKK
ncbi:FG-GAP repeat domain-containing protein [Chitinophaga sp. GCM10012297]|uniref:VCBS repeat-containing protein n=1 Tax=Chitinophaga chungangae TaxID=2821488 RepID=A0ABS3YJ43_9BACT|nr:VCBS repeat-containing protein [Chitinophaga chungangae]MBO9154701.1 VCBS repeat-containing protein [Chitinophaga chungangae]